MSSAAGSVVPVRDGEAVGRIIHLASYGGPYAGSFVPMLTAVAGAARERGYETTICFSEIARGRSWLDDITGVADVRFIDDGGLRSKVVQISRIIGEANGRPTVLHTHFGEFDVAAALLGASRRKRAVLWHAHGGRSRTIRLRSRLYAAVFGRMVDAILCVSPTIYEEARAMGYPIAKLRQFPNAIDTVRFSPITTGEREQARRELEQSSSDSLVLHLGWDWERKGGDLLLAAADLIAAEADLEFLTVLGEGEDADRDRFQAHPTVHALPPRGEVNALYAAADVFLNCSRSEGMPYSLLEALARGLLVVATDLPVQRELLEGLPGARIVSADPGAIVKGLREVLSLTEQERAEHARAARARVTASYALDAWSRRLIELYEQALR
jgi:glycosyltransferase involved in cell wall biosynthesis